MKECNKCKLVVFDNCKECSCGNRKFNQLTKKKQSTHAKRKAYREERNEETHKKHGQGNYMVGYHHEVRSKGELCSCGHPKDSHSSSVSGDTICYGSKNGDCKCGCSYPSRVRIPEINSVQEVNFNIKKPQFRPQRGEAKILEVIGAEQVYHKYSGTNVFVLCKVEVHGITEKAFVEWVDE